MKLEQNPQDERITIRASVQFLKGLGRAAKLANEPTVSEFIRKAVMEKGAALGVKIPR